MFTTSMSGRRMPLLWQFVQSGNEPCAHGSAGCLWFNKDAQDAARFYASTFPDSSRSVGAEPFSLEFGVPANFRKIRAREFVQAT